jgi:type IV secretion system protein VirB10
MALKPQLFVRQAPESDLSQPVAKAAPDTLAGLPASYGDTPKLGPPLPGDLGRPILRAQERDAAVTDHSSADDAEAKRQQRLAELKAARESGLLAQVTTGGGAAAAASAAGEPLSIGDMAPPTDSLATRRAT